MRPSLSGRALSGSPAPRALLAAICMLAAGAPAAVAQGADEIRIPAASFERAEFPRPGQRDKVRAAGDLSGGQGSWGVVGSVEYDVTVPEPGWYELGVSGAATGVEFALEPVDKRSRSWHFVGGTGAGPEGEKVGNALLRRGLYRLRLERHWWEGFPRLTAIHLRRAPAAEPVGATVHADWARTPATYRKGECAAIEFTSGGRARAASLNLLVWNLATSRTVATIPVPVRAGPDADTARVAVPCEPGSYGIAFAEGNAQLPGTMLRQLRYEVYDTRAPSLAQNEPKLVDTIDVVNTPPGYGGNDQRIVERPFGAYRETADRAWFRYQQLPAAARDLVQEPGWFAYSMPKVRKGLPYLFEVDYPDDAVRSFALALRESAPLSYPVAIGVDSGGEFRLTHAMHTARLQAWARADAPRLLVLNGRDGARAAVSRIRVYELDPRSASSRAPQGAGRQLFHWYEEGTNFASLYGPPDLGNEGTRLALERWAGAAAQAGYSVLVPTAAVYSFGLFPSRFNRAFSKPDDDLLRRMLLVAEGAGLRVLPELHPRADDASLPFAAAPDPKPNLLVSRDGKTPGSAPPLFNPLHPANQAWYLGLVGELADRYADSSALLGVSLRLMQWANPGFHNFHSLDWGYDDFTIDLYRRETRSLLPPGDPRDAGRFKARHDWLVAKERDQWIEWRCAKVTALMRSVVQRVRKARGDLRVYLPFFDAYPAGQGAAWLREAGIDLKALSAIDGLVTVNALHAYGRRYDEAVTQGTRDNLIDPAVLGLGSEGGASGHHLAYTRYFEATEAVVPPERLGFPASTAKTWMSAVLNPAGRHALERFALQLAQTDALALGDGGNGYTLGHADLREFAAAYRSLPATRFEAVPGAGDPVAVRALLRKSDTLLYAVNRERYPVTVEVSLSGDASARRMAFAANAEPAGQASRSLRLSLRPYELQSLRIEPAVRVLSAASAIPPAERELGQSLLAAATRALDRAGSRLDAAGLTRAAAKLEEARQALARNEPWRARTSLEHASLIAAYRKAGCLPARLRDGVDAPPC